MIYIYHPKHLSTDQIKYTVFKLMYMYHHYYVNVDFHNCTFPNELSMSQLIYTSTSINIIVAGNHVTRKTIIAATLI